MNKENVLFSVVGLLLGYVLAFTFATHYNLSGKASNSNKSVSREGGMPDGHPEVDPQIEQMREQLQQIELQARQDPNNFELQMQAAELNFNFERYEEAIDFLQIALKLRPDDYRVLASLAGLNEATGRFEMAEHWYKEAIKRKPDDINLRNFLGMAYMRKRPSDVEKALAEFRGALALSPTDELTLQNLTTALTRKARDEEADKSARRKSLQEADETLSKLESVNPDNEAIPSLRSNLSTARSSLETSGGRGRG